MSISELPGNVRVDDALAYDRIGWGMIWVFGSTGSHCWYGWTLCPMLSLPDWSWVEFDGGKDSEWHGSHVPENKSSKSRSYWKGKGTWESSSGYTWADDGISSWDWTNSADGKYEVTKFTRAARAVSWGLGIVTSALELEGADSGMTRGWIL